MDLLACVCPLLLYWSQYFLRFSFWCSFSPSECIIFVCPCPLQAFPTRGSGWSRHEESYLPAQYITRKIKTLNILLCGERILIPNLDALDWRFNLADGLLMSGKGACTGLSRCILYSIVVFTVLLFGPTGLEH